ncbi:MAG: hypothetical protein JW902_12885 [Syntrophaceae bacterium]|nr:hypothetical protein [Syntrophaceae bacterium]
MTDFTINPAFMALIHGVDQMILDLAQQRIPDAQAIASRYAGGNNLQGHARGLVPVAIWFARAHHPHLERVRKATNLTIDMSWSSAEARNRGLWRPIQRDFIAAIAANGTDIVTSGGDIYTPHSVEDIASTYLPTSWGGNQSTGGAGGTVIKRTLKIMSHTFLV